MKPRLTISTITTVKNEQGTIADLLERLLSQSLVPDEIIVTDGGSTDGTENVIISYQAKNNKIKYYNAPGTSIGGGRNAAIAKSNGDLLLPIDSGIWPSSDWIERVTEPLIADPNLDIAFAHVIYDTKSRIKPLTDFQKIMVLLTRGNEEERNEYLPGCAIRRRVWETLNGFPENPCCEDIVLLSQLKKMQIKSTFVPNAKLYYYSQPTTYKSVLKKWILHTKNSTLSKVAYNDFYKRVLMRGTEVLFFLAITVLIWVWDFRFIYLLLLLYLARLARRLMIHRELAKKLLKNPVNWVRIPLISITLDLGRTYGALSAFGESLRKHIHL